MQPYIQRKGERCRGGGEREKEKKKQNLKWKGRRKSATFLPSFPFTAFQSPLPHLSPLTQSLSHILSLANVRRSERKSRGSNTSLSLPHTPTTPTHPHSMRETAAADRCFELSSPSLSLVSVCALLSSACVCVLAFLSLSLSHSHSLNPSPRYPLCSPCCCRERVNDVMCVCVCACVPEKSVPSLSRITLCM